MKSYRGQVCRVATAVAALMALAVGIAVNAEAAEVPPTADAGKAIFDASGRFLGAAGYSVKSYSTSAGNIPREPTKLCADLAHVNAPCAEVDGTISVFELGHTQFFLSKTNSEFVLSAIIDGLIRPNLNISSYEVLCASYLADQASQRGLNQNLIRNLFSPSIRLTPILSMKDNERPVSLIETKSGLMVFLARSERISCHLLDSSGGPELVAADIKLR